MCGIYGFFSKDSKYSSNQLKKLTKSLAVHSESRGQDSSGLAVSVTNQSIQVTKAALPPRKFINSREFKSLLKNFDSREAKSDGLFAFGHARMMTNGEQGLNRNNQPVTKDGLVAIHNGIVTNVEELWKSNSDLNQEFMIDTEVLLALLRKYLKQGHTFQEALDQMYKDNYGMANLVIVPEDLNIYSISTNNGSLYCWHHSDSFLVFASELEILRDAVKESLGEEIEAKIKQMQPNDHILIKPENSELVWTKITEPKSLEIVVPKRSSKIIDNFVLEQEKLRSIKRCTKCILPETMPFIEFDEKGVCNYCNNHKPFKLHGEGRLKKIAEKAKARKGQYDCVLAFSGGRDSSYGLHYMVKDLGIKPVAYTYDWGMVTDLARRNQSRLCGKLGIEHVLVSANIKQKREFIKKNVLAWLKRPRLGMVPLFMAGDKQYFYYANKVAERFNTDFTVFCGNSMEQTGFKSGFAGVRETGDWYFNVPIFNKLQMVKYYAKEFLLNPSYINSSIFDTAFAYYAAYFIPHDYHFLFDYIPWDEEVINKTLIDEYDWEFAGDTDSSWRIGDGTAAFYNFIYYTGAGFTEYDTFRSIQIRNGELTREKALAMVEKENIPRFDSIREYARIIGFDFDQALLAISSMPKEYDRGNNLPPSVNRPVLSQSYS